MDWAINKIEYFTILREIGELSLIPKVKEKYGDNYPPDKLEASFKNLFTAGYRYMEDISNDKNGGVIYYNVRSIKKHLETIRQFGAMPQSKYLDQEFTFFKNRNKSKS